MYSGFMVDPLLSDGDLFEEHISILFLYIGTFDLDIFDLVCFAYLDDVKM